METILIVLLIMLGFVSAVLIILLIVIGMKLWKILSALQKIARFFSDETDQAQSILKKIRAKIHTILH
jgi:uncharacterized membrane protein